MNTAVADDAIDEAWSNIAKLRLRLAQSINFYQHSYRYKLWLIIADQQNDHYFRCNIENKTFLLLLDGSRTVEEALIEANQKESFTLSQQDIVLLIANLKASKLLQQNNTDVEDRSPGQQVKSKSNRWLRPFAIKFALFDPDIFLTRTHVFIKPLFSKKALFLWLAIIVSALITAWLHGSELLEHSQTRFADPKNLLWYWLLYPLVKALHELGHAFATKVWGGAVHEMGIMLLVFFPVPYVDSSAAHKFSSKNRRLLVSAAGIMVELFLAALALLIWVNTDAGMLHDMAFDIVIIASVSTIIFNANPLLRFDGYYILLELLEIPNLATRSNQYLGYLFKYYCLDIANSRSPITATGEAKWMFFYAISSTIYRLLISLFIAFWVAGKFFFIGLVLAIWALFSQIIFPVIRSLYGLITVAHEAQRLKRLTIIVFIFCMTVVISLIIPIGHSTYAEGLVNLPENALIRAGADGIVTDILIQDGTGVSTGEAILKLENLELQARRTILLAKQIETHARQKDVLLQDRKQADILKSRLTAIDAELKQVDTQIKRLNISSATQGVVFLFRSDDLPGRFIKRGEVIGYVANLKQVTARVVIPQSAIDSVTSDTVDIKVMLKSRPDEVLSAQLVREVPQMNNQLPSRLLGSAAGGHVAIDTRDETGMRAISNIFQLEVALPIRDTGNYLGQRLYLRFIHSRESLGNQLLKKLKLFLFESSFF